MSQPTHEDLGKLLIEVLLPFYLVKRDMRVPIGPRRLENDAEHSWALAVMACALAPEVDPSLDVGKVCQYAVVHDLVELHAGDTTPFGSKRNILSKEEREHQALVTIKQQTKVFPWLAQTITEYESRSTPEARFVWAADKYIALLTRHMDEGKFYRSIKLTKQKFDKRIARNRAKAHAHEAIGKYYDQLRAEVDASPHHFYQKDKK